MIHRLFALAVVLAAGGLPLPVSSAAAAAPAPGWTINSVSFPTNLTPGDSSGSEHYWLTATNVGGAPTDGSPIILTDTLPAGLTPDPSGATATDTPPFPGNTITCTAAGQTVTCVDPDTRPIAPGDTITASIPVDVAADAPSSVTNRVSITGGAASGASASQPTTVSASPAAFAPHSFDGSLTSADGSPDTQAGSHPSTQTTSFALSSELNSTGHLAVGANLKDVKVDLPAGLLGDPLATPRCTQAEFQPNACPVASQVGTIAIQAATTPGFLNRAPVYNLVPPAGMPAQFGFLLLGIVPVYLDASVRTGSDYGVTITSPDTPQSLPTVAQWLTFWGVPGDPSHDSQRCSLLPCSSPTPFGETVKPFLSLPTACAGPQTTTLSVDPWQDPGAFQTTSFVSHDNQGDSVGVTGCGALDFSPSVSVQPTSQAADSPTGLHVDIHVPQNEDPNGLATATLKDATVVLPPGVAVNPSAADGLGSCTEAQIELHGPNPASCPDSAKIGSVELDTPLLDHPLPGAVYVAAPHQNPFGSLLAIYIAVNDPQSGVVVKLAGHLIADPQTGQLTTVFSDNPQQPFDDLKLDFFNGPRAALLTPATCGPYSTATEMTPWSGTPAQHPSDSFSIGSGANGSACANSPAQQPNQPAFSAGTVGPLAGTYNPFVLHLSREDGSQRFARIDATLPPGLVGKLAGIPYCPDSALAAAAAKPGLAERAAPSCPAASRVGSVTVGAGAGPSPLHVDGNAYLTGPYRGAPLSLAIITPAVAGPYDLGTVVVRTALHVDPETAQISAESDPIPAILEGIPLDLRTISLDLDRPSFTLNPTSCDEMAVSGEAISAQNRVAPLRNRFQVGGCKGLDFKPRLALRVFGKTNRNAKPRFRAVLQANPGEASIARAQVNLPHSEFIEQNHIKTVCTRVQFAAGDGNGSACPPGSIYGHARAFTPLLDEPLEGPVYLRSSSHKLPDLVAALDGQIDIALDGKIDTGKNHGVRNTFEVVPDAPVSKFILEMKGGKKGLLVNSENLCSKKAKTRAIVRFVGHNGKERAFKPKLRNACKKRAKQKASGTGGRKHG